MLKHSKGVSRFLFGIIFMVLASTQVNAGEKGVIIGSGGVTGVYYPVAISICRLLNSKITELGFGCSVESTGGSVQNLQHLRASKFNFAIVQSDWQFHAYNGSSVFTKAGPDKHLRSVFSLYPEAFTVLARSKSNIKRFQDLRDHRVNIGNPGSGQRATMELVMRAFGWTRFSFSLVREFNSQQQSQALCDGEVDVIVFVAGHPSGSIKNATTQCSTNLVDVAGPEIKKLVRLNDYYRNATIPKGMYRGQLDDIQTFGVGATLATTSKTSDKLVKLLIKAVFENIDLFKSMHPALANLKPSEMMKDGLAAPLHEAARSFYREIGS